MVSGLAFRCFIILSLFLYMLLESVLILLLYK